MNSFKRKNILDFYKLNERVIDGEFVKVYSKKSMKSAFKNRGALTRGVKSICDTESKVFNGLYLDVTNVCDDLNKKYIGRKLVIATEFLKMCGFGSVYDTETQKRDEIEAGIKKTVEF